MFTVTVTAHVNTQTPKVPGGGVKRAGGGGQGKERTMSSPGRWRARSGRGDPRERGSITLMLLVLFVALIALAGIVIDGGAKLNQAENANAIAQEAARAGAGMVNPGNAYSTGSFTVDQSQAVAAARQYLAAAGYHGTVTTVGTESIQVTVTVTAPTRVLSIIGIDSMSSTGSATASLVAGVTGPGR
jgi:Flp pilus assembly protein TadG